METFTITGKNLEIVLKKIEKQYGPAAKVVSKKQIFLKSPFKKSLTKAIEITGVIDPDGSYQGEGESVDDLNRGVEASQVTDGDDDEEVPISPITIRRHGSTSSATDAQDSPMVDSKKLMQYHLGLSEQKPAFQHEPVDSDTTSTPPQSIIVEAPPIEEEREISPEVRKNAEIRMQAIESMIQSHNAGEESAGREPSTPEIEEKRHIQMDVALDRPSREENFRSIEAQIPEILRPKGGLEALSQHFSYGSQEEPKQEKKPSEDNPWHIKKLPPEIEPPKSVEENREAFFFDGSSFSSSLDEDTMLPEKSLSETESVPRERVPQLESAPQETFVAETPVVESPKESLNPEVLQGLVKEIESLRRQLELKTSPRGSVLTNISLKKVRELLGDNGFTHSAIEEFIDRITHELSPVDIKDYETLQAIIIQWMGEAITFDASLKKSIAPVVVVVGDSGTGKTSLIAKLAAEYGIRGRGGEPRLTRIASLDTRKVGAKEQVERYGTLMGLLVDVLGSIEEFDRLIDNSPDYRLILIDTPSGVSYTKGWVEDILKRMSDLQIPTEVILTVSATMKSEDIANTLKKYEGVGYNSIAITKLDETTTVGNLFSVLRNTDKPISFVTDGARVPGNLKVGSASDFMKKLQNFTVSYEETESLAMAAKYRKPLRGVSFEGRDNKKESTHQPTLDFMEPQG